MPLSVNQPGKSGAIRESNQASGVRKVHYRGIHVAQCTGMYVPYEKVVLYM